MLSYNNPSRQKFMISVRVRPSLSDDQKIYKKTERQQILEVVSKQSVTIQRKNYDEKTFKFNHIFLRETQEEIYQKSSHLVNSIFQGHNATFLAYGQTGTGKTHTIFGSKTPQNKENEKGYFHRAVDHIFSNIKQKMQSKQFAVRVSFVEFYLDSIYDLIEDTQKKLEIKQTPDNGIHVKDAVQIPVKTAEQLFGCVRQGILNRKTQKTSINDRSSRSHAVIQIQIIQRWNEGGQTRYIKGMLKIVDLAGSERVSKTQSFGPRLEEAKRINKQITTLGKCINMLAQSQKQGNRDITSKFNYNKMHIPYRDCKITRYLTDTLEGKSKIVLCVCISKYAIHLEQTFSSLMFATQASTLKVESKRNQVYTMKTSADKLAKRNSETPVKFKTQYKLNRSLYEEKDPKDDKAIQTFLQQINEIEDYLQGKGIKPQNQSKQLLQKNLISYEKVMKAMRQKLVQQRDKGTSNINFA